MITNKERQTTQKKFVIDYLKSTYSHPTAEEVYLAVRKKLPQISKATVYRILNTLKNQNQVMEIFSKVEKTNKFDGHSPNHAHFICTKCKKIFDINKTFTCLKLKNIEGHNIQEQYIKFYGICNKCKK